MNSTNGHFKKIPWILCCFICKTRAKTESASPGALKIKQESSRIRSGTWKTSSKS